MDCPFNTYFDIWQPRCSRGGGGGGENVTIDWIQSCMIHFWLAFRDMTYNSRYKCIQMAYMYIEATCVCISTSVDAAIELSLHLKIKSCYGEIVRKYSICATIILTGVSILIIIIIAILHINCNVCNTLPLKIKLLNKIRTYLYHLESRWSVE